MVNIDNKFLKRKFYEFTNKTFDLVSTIDHPYTSPPVRLIDGHNKLKILNNSGLKPLICIWDVNFPNINNYRHELIFDNGILGSRDKNFFIFSDELLYPLQKPKLIDFFEFKKRTQLVLERLSDLSKELKIERDKKFIENFEKITNVYIKTIKNSIDGTRFYQNLLNEIYVLIGLSDLAIFITDSFQPYFGSSIIQNWIPYCIQETENKPYGFLNLLDVGLFKKPYFRTTVLNNKEELSDPIYIKRNIGKILEQTTDKILIPSYEIFFWTLFLADIKHFGNDYGFFSKFKNIAIQYGFQPPQEIQITEHNEDSQNIIQFERDKSFNCFLKNGDYVIQKNNPVKNSRISSLPALYCHLGENLGKVIKNIFENKIKYPQIIKMGKYLL